MDDHRARHVQLVRVRLHFEFLRRVAQVFQSGGVSNETRNETHEMNTQKLYNQMYFSKTTMTLTG